MAWSRDKKCFVDQLYNKNQFVIYTPDAIIFQSYRSTIAYVTLNKATGIVDGLYVDPYYIRYSKTTSKHLMLFIKDYACSLNLNINTTLDLIKAIKLGKVGTFE